MRNATVKGLLAHKLRLALTALSVVLGVAFVAGTFVLTDTINHTFDTLFKQVSAGIDVTVRAKSGFGAGGGVDVNRDTIPTSLEATVRAVPGVKVAEGGVGGYAQLVDTKGKAITTSGAPNLGFSWTNAAQLSPLRLRSGRPPQKDGEVVVDVQTAKTHHLKVGDNIKVLFATGTGRYTIVGLTGFGSADNVAGATLAVFDLQTAQRVFDKAGAYDSIDVAADSGVSATELRSRIAAVLPGTAEAVTGDEVAKENATSVQQGLSFFSTFLLTFGGIALFVGAFIIFNTFSILVAQRTRELALLRALGASRRQVLGSVLVEALITGVFSSAVGLGLGVLFAIGLQKLLDAFGVSLPTTQTQFLPRTVIASFVVGIGVTVAAAISPARKAAKVPPVAAINAEIQGGPESLRTRSITGAVLSVLGVIALLTGLFGHLHNGLPLVGLGAALTFLGVAVLSPLVARPMASVIGAPLARFFHVSGKLGRENAMRSPRRTAATASALMIGLGLVGTVTVLASSIKSSSTKIFDESLAADYTVSTDTFMPTISPALATALQNQPGLEAVSGITQGDWRLNGAHETLYAADPEGLRQVLNVQMKTGDYASLARGDVLVDSQEAKAKKWTVGDMVPMTFARTGTKEIRIGGTYAENQLLGNYVISSATYDDNFTDRLDFVVLVKDAPGVGTGTARATVTKIAADYPNVKVQDQTQVKAQNRKQVDQLLVLVTVLLLLAIIIAFFGIVNTLALSVFERTRELGLLRAVGMVRRQVRAMIRAESVITSVIGAVLGLGIGVLFGLALQRALAPQGISILVVPVGQLISYVFVAAIAGVIAAVWPARRAARLNVLGAITYE